ncbi:MAG: PASTA domain-containing protein, partial [Eggerthellaceae bacterium]|nr:PASTA domain-containing protein [Eggerthellaceae bacterium]
MVLRLLLAVCVSVVLALSPIPLYSSAAYANDIQAHEHVTESLEPPASGEAQDPQDPQEPQEPQGQPPSFLSPASGVLPDALAGEPYWDAVNNMALVQFRAEGSPEPFYAIKAVSQSDSYPAPQRAVGPDGDGRWTGGGLPEGLALNEITGQIEGTPVQGAQVTEQQSYEFTVVAANDFGSDERTCSILVTDKSVSPATPDNPDNPDNPDDPATPDDPVAPEEPKEPEIPDGPEKPQTVQVPSLMDVDQSTAIRRLARAGLSVHVERVESGQPAGKVIAQDPSAGAQVEAGSTVSITVSDGPAEQAKPYVVSLSLYAHETNARGSYGQRIGANGREKRDGQWWVPQSMDQKGQRIRLCAAAALSDGRTFYQS